MGLRFFSAALRCLTLAISTSSSRTESAAISVGIELSLWRIWFADHRDLSDISQIDQVATFIWKCTDSVPSPALVIYLHYSAWLLSFCCRNSLVIADRKCIGKDQHVTSCI